MQRTERIRLVVATSSGLFALFVAFIAPLISVLFWPSLDAADHAHELTDAMEWSFRIANIVGAVSLTALVFAGICFLYVAYALAVWFIGPTEKPDEHTAG